MVKEAIYSLRLDKGLKEALARAARKDRRTIASLLGKIIADYLEKEGIEWQEEKEKD